MSLSFKNIKLVLASGSPRRQQFFKDMGFEVLIRLKEIEEVYSPHMKGAEIPLYLSALKAKALMNDLAEDELLITSDTIVWNKGKALGKPKDKSEAISMLVSMSGGNHEVITAVCFSYKGQQSFCEQKTSVYFKELSEAEIYYYVEQYQPYDKAGAYGIQEWIGLVGISHIEGSYNNVVGLPTHLVYSELKRLLGTPKFK